MREHACRCVAEMSVDSKRERERERERLTLCVFLPRVRNFRFLCGLVPSSF